MLLSRVIDRCVQSFRAGYAAGVADHGYLPLLALCRRRLSDDEVSAIVEGLIFDRPGPDRAADAQVAVTKLIGDLASLEDVDRVNRRLAGL